MLYTPSTTCGGRAAVSTAGADKLAGGRGGRDTHDDDVAPAALCDGGARELLEVAHVVVAEHAHGGARQAQAQDERGVVVLVAERQRAGAQQAGQPQRVGAEAHAHDERGLHAQEARRGLLQLAVQRAGAQLGARRAGRQPVAPHGLAHAALRAAARALREPQVVVRAQVDAALLHAREPAYVPAITAHNTNDKTSCFLTNAIFSKQV